MQSWAKTLRQNIFIIAYPCISCRTKKLCSVLTFFCFIYPKKALISYNRNQKKNLKISPGVWWLRDDQRLRRLGNKTQGPGHNHNNQSTTRHNADLSKPSSAHYPPSGRQCTLVILIAPLLLFSGHQGAVCCPPSLFSLSLIANNPILTQSGDF